MTLTGRAIELLLFELCRAYIENIVVFDEKCKMLISRLLFLWLKGLRCRRPVCEKRVVWQNGNGKAMIEQSGLFSTSKINSYTPHSVKHKFVDSELGIDKTCIYTIGPAFVKGHLKFS